MRRLRDRRPTGIFRGNELPRLLSMIVMLGVLALMITRARDANLWAWLAPQEARPGTAELVEAPVATPDPAMLAADPPPAGPTDREPDEWDAGREELQAVSDKTPLAKEEMPAYWRLMAWQRNQSIAELNQRASSVTYRDLWNDPQQWRGKLIKLQLHLVQTALADNLTEDPLELKSVSEAWGWNSDSQPYTFWLVTPQLPPGMPGGTNLSEEVTFVGYFLKLAPYEDHEGKTLATPLLIGRLVWHPTPDGSRLQVAEAAWTWWVLGGLAVLMVVRLGWSLLAGWKRAGSEGSVYERRDDRAVENWLAGRPEPPTNGASEKHYNSEMEPPSPRGRNDWTPGEP